jgi:two-component system, chemotaxis family, chemotaxis protein CheY
MARVLVITDLVMPEKEGIETIVELRRDFRNLKIIAVSGGAVASRGSNLTAAGQLGANLTCGKPLQMSEFLDAVRDLLAS